MPVPPDFLIISARLTQLLSSSQYDKARALIETMDLTPDLRTYFTDRINDHQRYLGPDAVKAAPGKKPPTQ